jgi:uncharacterized protein YndB with AHSA1/START domain
VPFPTDRVWHALTDPTALAAWFWPERFATTAEVDLRPGGRFRIAGPGVGIAVAGQYVVVEPPHRLVFTWQWAGEEEETLVTVELTPSRTGTDLLLMHERFADEATRDEHATGWTDCLNRLPDWLAAQPPSSDTDAALGAAAS